LHPENVVNEQGWLNRDGNAVAMAGTTISEALIRHPSTWLD
jgi:hypothetical protein